MIIIIQIYRSVINNFVNIATKIQNINDAQVARIRHFITWPIKFHTFIYYVPLKNKLHNTWENDVLLFKHAHFLSSRFEL